MCQVGNAKVIAEKRMLQRAILSRKQGGNKTMVLDKATKQVYRETAQALKGSDRRLFMARVVKGMGDGGQRQAERELGWNRRTIRKGLHELVSGHVCLDGYAGRGRQRAGERLPHLLEDISDLGDGQSQRDARFESRR